jgi:putative FmdB family regulatory protein
MPTYEYACKSCGEHVEVVQSFRDEPLSECPACGGPLRKVFGNVGIVLKGSGFYKTDSRAASKAAAKSESASSSSEPKSSDNKSSDSKPSDSKSSESKSSESKSTDSKKAETKSA